VKQDVAGERILQRERLRRDRRLRSPRDFERVRRRGRHVGGALLALSYARREGQASPASVPTRFGFAVGKRVGGAVAPGWDVIVTARSGAAAAERIALDAALAELLARARLCASSGITTPSGPIIPSERSASL